MLVIIGIMLAILISIVFTSYKYGIGPMPTSPTVKKAWISILQPIDRGTIYELGAGWGTLAFILAKHYPKHSIVAFEISPIPYLGMRLRQLLSPRPNLKIVHADFFQQDLKDASLIVCYLFPNAMKRLETKLAEECPNALIISHTFAFPTRRFNCVHYAKDLYQTPIYIYGNCHEQNIN